MLITQALCNYGKPRKIWLVILHILFVDRNHKWSNSLQGYCVFAGGGYIGGNADLIDKAKAVVLGLAGKTVHLSDRTAQMLAQGMLSLI
jgi:hypothetical protein